MALKFRPVNRALLRRVHDKVRRCKKERHRPTVALLIEHHETGQFLLIESKNGKSKNPGLVKGGIGNQESMLDALYREAEEEVGFTQSQVRIFGYAGSRSVSSAHTKSGLRKKRYFIVHVVYDGPLELTINTDELSGYRWCSIAQVQEHISILLASRPEKHAVLTEVFIQLERTREERRSPPVRTHPKRGGSDRKRKIKKKVSK